MKLLVIRHGIAEDAQAWAAAGEPETLRPLTDAGRKKMKKAARGLRALVERIDLLATSPLTRAAQTAEIVAREFDALATAVTAALEPGRAPQQFLEWLRDVDEIDTVAVVGHEPHLSMLVGWLLSGREVTLLELKKGGACLLELERQSAPGTARLHWLLEPRALRRLRQ